MLVFKKSLCQKWIGNYDSHHKPRQIGKPIGIVCINHQNPKAITNKVGIE